MITVKRHKIGNEVYRLANLGYALGYAIQIRNKSGRSYHTIEHLGWVTEADARAFFNKYVTKE